VAKLFNTRYYPDWTDRQRELPIIVNLDTMLYATPHENGTWIRYNGGDSEKGLVLVAPWEDFVAQLAQLQTLTAIQEAPAHRTAGSKRPG
jgi:hypothetical protein